MGIGRCIAPVLAAVLSVAPLSARNGGKWRNEGMRWLESSFSTYHSIQKDIHSFAEPGYLEFRSSALLIAHLEENGFSVERCAAGIPTAFVATFGSGSPVVGFLAEYDALPGMSQDTVAWKQAVREGGAGHGCGHNILGTGALAAAVATSKWLSASGREGTVILYGCPAEEGGGGKAYMTREGCFDRCDAVFDWHPDVTNVVNWNSGTANVQIAFRFHGTSSHAASGPENGRSALDAVEAFDFMMNLMREHVPSDSRIHYVITKGGKSPNIVPDEAEVVYYLRNPRRDVVSALMERALDAARGAAMGTGTTMDYEILSGNYERLVNRSLSDAVQANLESVGGVEYDGRETAYASELLRNSGVVDIASALSRHGEVLGRDEHFETSKWVSSDVGNVSWAAPVASVRIAGFLPAGSGHCWQQASCAGTTIGTKALMNAAKVMFLTAWDIFNSPELLRAVRSEFESSRGDGFVFVPLMGDRRPPLDYRK